MMMTPTTLQALRRLLFFSQPEAAVLIGGVTERSWRFWEEGQRTIPADVIERIAQLIEWREAALQNAEALISESTAGLPSGVDTAPPILIWYATAEDWATLPGREPALWRPHCSVIAELCARCGAQAILFNGPAYAKWLNGREDSETKRGEWAATTAFDRV